MTRNAGFTLLELLVAIAITLVVAAAILVGLNDAVRMNQGVMQVADMQENLRGAMNLMVRDIVQTGEGIPIGGIPIPSGGSPSVPINRPGPTAGGPLTFPSTFTTLPAVTPGATLGPLSLGQPTDMATVLYADNTLPLNTVPTGVVLSNGKPSLTVIAANGSSLTVDPSVNTTTGNTALQPGDLIMFNNAQGAALQVITRLGGGQTVFFDKGDAFGLNQRTDPQGTIFQIQSPANSGIFPPTSATRVYLITYFLDTTSIPGYPRLIRQVNFNPSAPVGEVIENIQVTYDLVDGVTNPTNVKTPPAGNSPNQIRKVNLYLAARSARLSIATKQYLRQNLLTQVSLRSLAFVNRYQ